VLVERNNFAELGKALGRLMDDPAAAEGLAIGALAGAARFEIATIAAHWEALFAELGGQR
jgi:hypothetical protein